MDGRIGFGPVDPDGVPGLFDAGFPVACDHPLALGRVEDIDWLKRQQRVCFARNGIIDPLDLDDYRAHGGWNGLERALAMAPADIVQAITESGLRGRGGAAFPCGIKWKTVADQVATQKYIVCNADEGDSGTFSDRMAMEGDPYRLIEGMLIAALAVGASRGFIYLRSEYPVAHRILDEAIRRARAAGWLGADVRGSGRAFDIDLRLGAGAYICGEETSLLESLEGRRGQVRFKPPLPAIKGLFGQPTVVNNVITLASVPDILVNGGAWYRDLGMGRSRGTLPIQLAGNIRRGGLIELAFGVSLARAALRLRRRQRQRSPDPCRAGRWAARRLPARIAVRHADRLRGLRRDRRAARARRHRRLRRHASTWPNRRASRWNSARSNPAASARRAGSAPPAASR